MKRYKTEIVAENVILLSSPVGQESGSYGSSSSSPAATESVQHDEEKPRKSKPKVEEDISIEDIPF